MVELLINNVFIPVERGLSSDIGTNDIGDLSTRNGEVSASFDINATPENLAAFNGVFNRRIDAQVYNNGTLQSTGYVLVSERALKAGTITLDYFGEVSDLSDLLGDLTLKDLDWSDLDHDKTVANVVASFSSTEGYVYPFIDFNFMELRAGSFFGLNDLSPAIFLKTVVSKILNQIGYTLQGSILNDYVFNKAILQYVPSSPEINTIGETYGQVVYGFYSQGYPSYIATDYIRLGTNITSNLRRVDTGGNFDFGNDRYIAPRDGLVKVYGYFKIDKVTPLVIKKNGVEYASLTRDVLQADFFLFYVPVVAGDYIEVENFVNGATFDFIYDVRIVMSDFSIDGLSEMHTYVEEIPCADVLKFVINYYCGLVSVNAVSKVVTINKVNDIINNIPNAYDWTSKIDRSREVKIKYNDFNSDYGQRTIFMHKEPSEDAYVEKYKGILKGELLVSNDTLPRESEFYESPFVPVVYEVSNARDLSRVDRFTFENQMSFTTSSTSDGYLKLTSSSAHGLSAGDYICIDASSANYIGIQLVIDILNDTKFVVNSLYDGVATGSFRKAKEVREIETRIMLFDSMIPAKNMSVSSVALNGVDLTEIPFTYSCLDNPNADTTGTQKRTYVTWSKKRVFVNGLEIDVNNSNGLLEEYWSDASIMLAKGESIDAYMHLDSIEVKDHDYSRPIYIQDTSSYYYLNKIDNYKYKKGIYLCKLIRLN